MYDKFLYAHNIMKLTYQQLVDQLFTMETTKDYSLEKVRKWAELLGNPQDTYKVIHITGTNGKWSVANMCFSILSRLWKKVGIFTSPHLIDIRERFTTEKWKISKKDFVRITQKITSLWIPFSYFELCTLIWFEYFKEQGCEYAIIEVWFWWLLDSTNIVHPTICCITSIGYDHQHILGNTLEEIAFQKAGIIKQHIPVVINKENRVIQENAKQKNAPVFLVKDQKETNLLGEYQKRNAALAYKICDYLWYKKEDIEQWLQQVQHKWRLEFISQNILIDWAHNEDGLRSLQEFLSTIQHEYQEIIYGFSLKHGKSTDLITNIFGKDKIYTIIKEKNTMLEPIDNMIREMTQEKKIKVTIASPRQIRNLAKKYPKKLYVIFGSLYMIGTFYT